jgi:hypothetical protein
VVETDTGQSLQQGGVDCTECAYILVVMNVSAEVHLCTRLHH